MSGTGAGTRGGGARWLVVGANGMLGHDLIEVLHAAGVTAIGMGRPTIDITSPESVAAALAATDPDIVVNAAAFTAVDAAETDEASALAVNGHGPRVLAEAVAARPGSRLLHISTDYVFAGDATRPYAEDAEPDPRCAYGRTKLAGERAVRAALPDRAWVVRTAWLYGAHGPNFVKAMLTLEASRAEVSVVDDQRGQPTWARDLAHQILVLVGAGAPAGIYHGTSSGDTTWYEFAREIYQQLGTDPGRVRPVTSSEFPRPAPRPSYSVLGHDGWDPVGLAPIRPWRDAIAEALPLIRAAG